MNTPEAIVQVDRLYTIDEAAMLLGLKSGDWIRTQISTGNLEYVDLNAGGQRKKLRLRASTINRLIDEHTIGLAVAA